MRRCKLEEKEKIKKHHYPAQDKVHYIKRKVKLVYLCSECYYANPEKSTLSKSKVTCKHCIRKLGDKNVA